MLENFPNNVSAQNIDVAIDFLLIFLDDVSNHFFNGKKMNEVLEKVGAIAGDILYVVQKLLPSFINKDDTSKVNVCSIQILEKTKDLKAQVKTCYKSLKFTPSQFPTVGGLGFLDSLLRKFNEMLKSESGLDFTMRTRSGILDEELSSLTSILAILEEEFSSLSSVFREVHHEHEILKDLQRRTINLAYEAEVAIDSILVQYNVLWHSFLSLPTILKEIKHIRAKVTEMWSENLALKPCYVVEPSKRLVIQHSDHANDEEIVGFESEAGKIIQYLIRGTNELDVISIVGMGGQGKTTIARKVYNNDMIASHFDRLAWCCISQTYDRIELLEDFYKQICSSEDNEDKDPKDELADKLRKRLFGRRYLIVLDDMWDVKAWEDLTLSFPKGENRSRIIVTTRLEKVGTQIKQHTEPYFLPFLPPEESSALLWKRVFKNECPPPELYNVSLAVAERCKGLPLVIILVSGIIKRKKMEASWWHEVKDSLLSYLGESEEYSLTTMKLSYDYLPDYLRPCLLYMGMFQEDARIQVSKLIRLWIAEGFVQNIESGKLEEAAEGYLMDLISSNVVMVSMRRYSGKVKYCQVHDIVLDFCMERSREEKFMLTMKGHRSQFQPFDWKENRLSFTFSNELSKLGSKTGKPFHRHLRSLVRTNGLGWNPFPQISKCGLIKVLDLSSNRMDHFSSATLHQLIHLKYLAVSICHFDFHPESHLRHLETFVVKGGSRVLIPSIFWKMEKLRYIECYASFDLESNKQRILDESSVLKNLRTLKKVEFPIDDADCMDLLSRRCPNLQELEISMFSDEWHSAEICTSSPNFECLSQLQLLDLCFRGSNIIVSELHLPSNLKKLVVYGPHIVSVASLIAGLPNLEYLQLKDWRRESEEWCLGDITIDKLKFLKLVELGISRWDALEPSFPQIEILVIKHCYHLEEIPLCFEDIPTLEKVKFIACCKSLKDSAVKIKEEIEEVEGCDL